MPIHGQRTKLPWFIYILLAHTYFRLSSVFEQYRNIQHPKRVRIVWYMLRAHCVGKLNYIVHWCRHHLCGFDQKQMNSPILLYDVWITTILWAICMVYCICCGWRVFYSLFGQSFQYCWWLWLWWWRIFFCLHTGFVQFHRPVSQSKRLWLTHSSRG